MLDGRLISGRAAGAGVAVVLGGLHKATIAASASIPVVIVVVVVVSIAAAAVVVVIVDVGIVSAAAAIVVVIVVIAVTAARSTCSIHFALLRVDNSDVLSCVSYLIAGHPRPKDSHK